MAEQRRTGRPPKYASQTVRRIVEAIELGASFKLAAHAGGISESTLHEWRHKFPDFSERVAAAQAKLALDLLRSVKRHAEKSPQAAMWRLERMFPQEYGRAAFGPFYARDGGNDEAGEIAQTINSSPEVQAAFDNFLLRFSAARRQLPLEANGSRRAM